MNDRNIWVTDQDIRELIISKDKQIKKLEQQLTQAQTDLQQKNTIIETLEEQRKFNEARIRILARHYSLSQKEIEEENAKYLRDCELEKLYADVRQREADAAAMREVLVKLTKGNLWMEEVDIVLSKTAGTDLLARLEAAERVCRAAEKAIRNHHGKMLQGLKDAPVVMIHQWDFDDIEKAIAAWKEANSGE